MDTRFHLASEPIDPVVARKQVLHPSAGALAVFEGWVRDHHRGASVEALTYQAFGPLAEAEGERILEEATAKFGLRAAHCIHRVGDLAIGDTAVWIGVASDHRDSAFAACRYIIDEIKARVPIWKKEFYPEKPPVWVDPRAEHSVAESAG